MFRTPDASLSFFCCPFVHEELHCFSFDEGVPLYFHVPGAFFIFNSHVSLYIVAKSLHVYCAAQIFFFENFALQILQYVVWFYDNLKYVVMLIYF